jgi:hypothetical protein
MKNLRTLFILASIIIQAQHSRAQCPSNKRQLETAAGYGLINSGSVTGQLNYTSSGFGTPFATARYFMFNRLAFGVYAGFTSENGAVDDYFNPSRRTTLKKKHTTIAVELYYIYAFRKRLEIYTLLGAGQATVTTETTNATNGTTARTESSLKAHYTPVGVRYGGRLGIFAELGLGYKGIINGGISFKFGSPCWWKQ